jgi:hypothetical protein
MLIHSLVLMASLTAPAPAALTPTYRCTDEAGHLTEVRVKGDEARIVADGEPEQVLVRKDPADAFRTTVPRERCWDDGCEKWNEDHRFAPRPDGTATLSLEQFSTCRIR